jgi:hypothetical protein
VTEDFLHFIWRQKLWNFIDAKTVTDEPIVIKNSGISNHMDGPDFLEASIIIGDTLWNGHVEIHTKSSEWFQHGHQNDAKYQPVILHVVFEDDAPGKLDLPTLELKGKIKKFYYDNYQTLIKTKSWLPCGDGLKNYPQAKLRLWQQRLLVERFQEKNEQLESILIDQNNHWEHVLFIWVMRTFGYHYNANAMQLLASRTPFSLIQKITDIKDFEVLLTGLSGFALKEPEEQQLFAHWIAKYQLEPLDLNIWINKVRPQVRPPMVFNKVGTLYVHQKQLFAHVKSCFENYVTNKELPFKALKELTKSTQEHLWLNAFIPVMMLYASSVGNESWLEDLWQLMEYLKPDKNGLIQKFVGNGITVKNAAQSQSLIHLQRNYCSVKKCLNCPVGLTLVKTQ